VNHRGYNELYEAVHQNKLKGVKAFFLTAKRIHNCIDERGIHNYIDEISLLAELNNNAFDIQFEFLHYDPDRINAISTDEVNVGVKIK
jgi:hypothetical protein